jgi:hypothetical protein
MMQYDRIDPAKLGPVRGPVVPMSHGMPGHTRGHMKPRHLNGRQWNNNKSLFRNIVSGIDSSLREPVGSLHKMSGITELWRSESRTLSRATILNTKKKM